MANLGRQRKNHYYNKHRNDEKAKQPHNMEKGLEFWVDQTAYNILWCQRLTLSKALTLFKAEGGQETTEESLELAEVDSWGLRK